MTSWDINVMEFRASTPQQAEKPCEFRAFIITAFQKRRLNVNRYAVFYKFRNELQAVQGYFVRMNKMGRDLQPLAGLLQLQILHFQVVEPERMVVVKKVVDEVSVFRWLNEN